MVLLVANNMDVPATESTPKRRDRVHGNKVACRKALVSDVHARGFVSLAQICMAYQYNYPSIVRTFVKLL